MNSFIFYSTWIVPSVFAALLVWLLTRRFAPVTRFGIRALAMPLALWPWIFGLPHTPMMLPAFVGVPLTFSYAESSEILNWFVYPVLVAAIVTFLTQLLIWHLRGKPTSPRQRATTLGGQENGGRMKALWYVLVLVFGLVGVLSILANLEHLVFVERTSSKAAGLLIGFVCLYAAWKVLGKARNANAE